MSELSTTPTTERTCQNCEHPIDSAYCPRCGQRDLDFRKDWRGLVGEYASSFLNIDGKVIHGITNLLFRPGLITQVFLSGKRSSQIPPLRLYLFASLLFFLWVTSQQGSGFGEDPIDSQPAQVQLPTPADQPEFVQKIAEKFENPEALQASFNTWLPRVFLLGVPLFALATRLLFRKRPFVYLEHIIISMHLQTFLLLWIFIVGILSNLVGLAHSPSGGYFWNIAIWWVQLYPVFFLRRIFELTWAKAIGATLLLELIILLLVTLGMSLVFALAIWLA